MPFHDEDFAATLITSAARGYIARKALRAYYKDRYSKVMDMNSGYYYFQDNYFNDVEPMWYKPFLAFPDDVEVYEYTPDDPQDFMKGKGNKYTYKGFITGPYVRRQLGGVGKKNTTRAENGHFVFTNPLRPDAIVFPEEVDLESTPLGSLINLMDGLAPKQVLITDYVAMRRAVCFDNCDYIVHLMEEHMDRPLMQAYGFHAISKIIVPTDEAGNLSYSGRKAHRRCFDVIVDSHREYSYTLKIFALRALHNILNSPAGRAEFFDTSSDPQGLGALEGPAGKIILSRMRTLCRLLENLPLNVTTIKIRDGRQLQTTVIETVTEEASQAAEFMLQCISLLSWNQDMREIVGEVFLESVLIGMQTCHEEAGPVAAGFKALYNFVYRCEVNHQLVNNFDIDHIISNARNNFPGDATISMACRKLELALSRDGWRGNVERVLEREYAARLDGTYKELSAEDSVSLLDGSEVEEIPEKKPQKRIAGAGKKRLSQMLGEDKGEK